MMKRGDFLAAHHDVPFATRPGDPSDWVCALNISDFLKEGRDRLVSPIPVSCAGN
jgi:hypothetical protein